MMATISPHSNMTRQPFGLLDGGRLRNLSNVKNTQNAISTIPAANLKRRYESPSFDDVENVDPSIYCSPTKKSKTGLQDKFEPPNPTKFMEYTSTNTMKSSLARQIRSPHRSDPISTRLQGNKFGEAPTTPATPAACPTPRNIDSAPAVAGRSPKSKRIGILSRRRMTTSPFTRVNPPSFSSNGVQGGLPFSIDAALSGTVPSYKPSPVQAKEIQPKEFCTLEESMPKGWMFDIYEETEEIQEQNVVVHRACNLDISDDENLAKIKLDRGKENIPPSDGLSASLPEITTSIPASRKNMMTDEPRTPLGDLETSEFYAEGCDALSYIIIPGENSVDQNAEKPNVDPEPKEAYSSPQAPVTDLAEGWQSLLAQVEASKQNHTSDFYHQNSSDKIASAPAVEIWESESAKDEDESHGLDQAGQYAA